WTAPRMMIPAELRFALAAQRRAAKISNGQLCQVLDIRQPGTFQAWELGTSQPTQAQLEVYLLAIGGDAAAVWQRVLAGPSRLAQICNAEDAEDLQYVLADVAGGGRDYVRLAALEREDLDWFADRDDLVLAPDPRGKTGIARRIELTPGLLALVGGYVAAGAHDHAGIVIRGGATEPARLAEVARDIASVFGLPAAACEISPTTNDVMLAHRVAALAWRTLFGTDAGPRIPDRLWTMSEELRSAFLRGYVQTTGDAPRTSGRPGLALVATSRDLASGLSYLLSSYGVVGTSRAHDGRWTITVENPAELERLRAVWQDLPGTAALATAGHEGRGYAARPFEALDGDLMTLAITEVTEACASNGNVYDFSVADDENFIAGFGGLAACNTDADVDGSHIRTLLLTFFFRHFNELFEQGHVYIAQPPLYKVKKGKTELYLKNEGALEDYLLDSVCRESVLNRGTEAPLTGAALVELVKRISQARRLRAQLDKRSDGRITAQFAEAGLSENDLKDRERLTQLEAQVMAEVSRRHGELGQASASYNQDVEHGNWELRFPPGVHGIRRATVLNSDLVRSAEFVELRRLSAELRGTLTTPLSLQHQQGDAQPIDNWDEIATAIEELGRKGLQIQRYKGLGEMNAEQLWETTMDPTQRNLLRVKVEEMEAADGIFSKLMGDLVEPRRAFIEENALNVRNLDV
ncbi:MAG: DNA gyrase subunit B, partial [Myxococcales bacterium]|nr:DNA gyrase subunit B [Myxococcales bacterium]